MHSNASRDRLLLLQCRWQCICMHDDDVDEDEEAVKS
jgi:hypothetical protein